MREKAVEVAKAFQLDQPLPEPKSLSKTAEAMLTQLKQVKEYGR